MITTRVHLLRHGEVYNPLFRFVSRFIFGHHRTIDHYLEDLERHLARER